MARTNFTSPYTVKTIDQPGVHLRAVEHTADIVAAVAVLVTAKLDVVDSEDEVLDVVAEEVKEVDVVEAVV